MARKKPREGGAKAAAKVPAAPGGAGFAGRVRESGGAVFLVLFPILAFALYAKTMTGPFVFDDVSNISGNVKMRLYSLSWEGLKAAAVSYPSPARILPNMSFAVNFFLGGYHVEGYHAVNVLVHVLAALGLFLFARATLRTPALAKRGHSAWLPLAASLLFLVQPLATNVAAYIVQRMASMAAMFYVFSFWCYVEGRLSASRGRAAAFFAGCLVFFACSLASKQNAATLPVLAALYEWFFFRDLSRRSFLRFLPVLIGAVLLVGLAWLYFTNFDPARLLTVPYEFRDFTLSQRLLTQFRVVVLYVTLLLFPLPGRMNLDWDFPKSVGLFSPPSTFLSMLLIVAALAWAVWAARKQRLLSFCVFWFFGNLVIESSFLPLEMVFEHRTYLPSMLFFVLAADLVLRGLTPQGLAFGVLAAVAVFFSAATVVRNRVWTDSELLWRDAVAKSPEKARPYYNLCEALTSRGRPGEAIPVCERGIALGPHEPYGYFNLALALEDPRVGRIDEAFANYKKTVELSPENAAAINGMAQILVRKGRQALKAGDKKAALALFEEALPYIQNAVNRAPQNPTVWLNAGRSLYMMGNAREAVAYFKRALAIDPGYAKAHNNIGIAYLDLKMPREAVAHLERSLALSPDDSVTAYNLALMLERMGDAGAALRYYRQAAGSTPRAREQMEASDAARKAIERLAPASGQGGPP